MPYIIRLRKADGTVVDLPEIYPGNAPSDETRVGIPFQGGMIEGKVERCLARDQSNDPSKSGSQNIPVLVVTMLRWIERKPPGTID